MAEVVEILREYDVAITFAGRTPAVRTAVWLQECPHLDEGVRPIVSAEDFQSAFSRLVRETGRWRDVEPDALLERWNSFVTECERGYPRDQEDYSNDLTSRSSLELALTDDRLKKYPELSQLRAEVAAIDDRFRSLLIPGAFPSVSPERWWIRGMVRYAGRRLVEEMKGVVDIDIVE